MGDLSEFIEKLVSVVNILKEFETWHNVADSLKNRETAMDNRIEGIIETLNLRYDELSKAVRTVELSAKWIRDQIVVGDMHPSNVFVWIKEKLTKNRTSIGLTETKVLNIGNLCRSFRDSIENLQEQVKVGSTLAPGPIGEIHARITRLAGCIEQLQATVRLDGEPYPVVSDAPEGIVVATLENSIAGGLADHDVQMTAIKDDVQTVVQAVKEVRSRIESLERKPTTDTVFDRMLHGEAVRVSMTHEEDEDDDGLDEVGGLDAVDISTGVIASGPIHTEDYISYTPAPRADGPAEPGPSWIKRATESVRRGVRDFIDYEIIPRDLTHSHMEEHVRIDGQLKIIRDPPPAGPAELTDRVSALESVVEKLQVEMHNKITVRMHEYGVVQSQDYDRIGVLEAEVKRLGAWVEDQDDTVSTNMDRIGKLERRLPDVKLSSFTG